MEKDTACSHGVSDGAENVSADGENDTDLTCADGENNTDLTSGYGSTSNNFQDKSSSSSSLLTPNTRKRKHPSYKKIYMDDEASTKMDLQEMKEKTNVSIFCILFFLIRLVPRSNLF